MPIQTEQRNQIKCANCKRSHKATHPKYPVRLQAAQQAKKAIIQYKPYHDIPESLKQIPIIIFNTQPQRRPENPRKRVTAGSPELETAQPLNTIHPPPTPLRPRQGRTPKSKSSTDNSVPLPGIRDKVSTAYSATQSQYSTQTEETQSTRLRPAIIPYTDPEHPEQSQQYTEIAKRALGMTGLKSNDPIASTQNNTISNK
jgi:hypothetical protein